MSRRKQSIPCKVQGATDFPSYSHETKMSEKFNQNAKEEKYEQSLQLNIVERDVINGELNQQDDISKEDSAETKQQRFSARLRARSMIIKSKSHDDVNSQLILPYKRKLDDDENIIDSAKKVFIIPDDQLKMFKHDSSRRLRTASYEEELTCPICNKAFMSKYGLLTHSEIHSTPELKCSLCVLSFPTRSAFVAHQMTVHMKRNNANHSFISMNNQSVFQKGATKNFKSCSGFDDLSFIDFTCSEFPAISEVLCSKTAHRLSERDRQHFFMCKNCKLLYPTLSSLKLHMNKVHCSVTNGNKMTVSKLTMAGKTYIISSDKPISSTSNETESNCTKTLIISDGINFNDFTKSLGLISKDFKAQQVKEIKEPLSVGYGMDSNTIRTSPMVAYLKVPLWLRTHSTMNSVNFNADLSDRPPIKMKLIRCREDGSAPITQGGYFVDDPTAIIVNNVTSEHDGNFTCETCGEVLPNATALGGHRAASICGIGVKSSSNGRRMYWCRLCNYASFEKSTILRHQRTHTGVRPYSCKFCNIAFTTKANCERHIRKRHRVRISSDIDVKNAVYCDYDLLKKARDGEINLPQSSLHSLGSRFFSFQCRICKAAFSSRSNGARHVMTKHNILNRKGANEAIMCVRIPSAKPSGINFSDDTPNIAMPDNIEFEKCADGNSKYNTSPEEPLDMIQVDSSSQQATNAIESKLYSIKPPKLIPLLKISSYNQAAHKLRAHFQNNYDDLLSSLNIDVQDDVHQISSKLLSLLTTTSSLIKRNLLKKKNQPGLHDSKNYSSVAASIDPHPFLPMDVDEEAPCTSQRSLDYNGNQANLYNGECHDMVQLYAEGKLDDFNEGSNDAPSRIIKKSSTKSQPTYSQSLILRQFAAKRAPDNKDKKVTTLCSNNDLASIKDLVDLAQHTTLSPLHGYKSKMDKTKSNESENELVSSMNSELKGKYLMVASKPKPTPAKSIEDKPALTWRFIPEPPKLRDEKGRYIRDPQSPYPSVHKSLSITPYNQSRPTMVPIRDGKLNLNEPERKSLEPSRSRLYKGRKCPKCDKIFPWASSLSRHIMTHTGLKPFMCARCTMRFTTRSNLLRHAYRRHGLERGSEERHNLLVTLTMEQQKDHAEKEAMKLVEQENSLSDISCNMNEPLQQEEVDDEDQETLSEDKSQKNPEEIFNQIDQEAAHLNKRYVCGLCRLPFANRSNLVRHLHRLHDVTKDHPNFKEMLVKINKTNVIVPPPPLVSDDPPSSSPTNEESTIKENNLHFKAFTCSICSIGFTKRNNAARHIQHQHNINRKSENFHELIIRNFSDSEEVDTKGEVIKSDPDLTPADTSSNTCDQLESSDVKQQDDAVSMLPQIPIKEEEDEKPFQVIKEEVTSVAPAWRGRRRSASRKKLEEEANVEAKALTRIARQVKKKDRVTPFVCGICKRIYKDVEELKEHLEEHNIPHPWHCTICGVPFTNKYNCQRHLMRRHGAEGVEPKYVKDIRHGPRSPRKRYKAMCR